MVVGKAWQRNQRLWKETVACYQENDDSGTALISREVSKPRDLCLELSHPSEIWRASRQQCCPLGYHISKQYGIFNHKSRGSGTWYDPTKRRLIHPASEKGRYYVTSPPIGGAHYLY